jgi:carbonic anhydrase
MTLDHLFDRNVEWVARKRRDDPGFFVRMAEQQTPNYLWIGCADSRITANDVLGLDPGEVFVQRNVANMVHTSDMNLLAVLEFAVETLKVGHVIVCGHTNCGGVRRAMGPDRSALVDHWLQPLVMLYRKHAAVFSRIADEQQRLDRLCALNVQMQVRRVMQTPIVEAAWARGQPLQVHGWLYGVEDGLLRELGAPVRSLSERDRLPTIDDCARNPVEPVSAMRLQALAAFGASTDSEIEGCRCAGC